MFYPINPAFQISEFYKLVFDRRFPKDFHFDGEKHDFWEIVYVVDGKVEVTEDEKVYILGERDMVFHAPDEFHRLRSAESSCPRVMNISFRISGEMPEHLKNGVLHLSSALHEEYTRIVGELQDCIKKEDGFFGVSLSLSSFFMRLIHESHTKDSLSTSAGAQVYRTLVKLMHNEVYKNLSLEDFSKKSYISVSYIKKLFNHYAGIGPKSYYSSLRLIEAQKLLLSGFSATEVAEKLNFSSSGYFTIFFKNQTGYTPTQYRKSNEN